MPVAKKPRASNGSTETELSSSDMMFDYKAAAKAARVLPATLKNMERRAMEEFPHDPMLMELHVLRAIKAYSSPKRRKGKK
jgi:hypothetical protein